MCDCLVVRTDDAILFGKNSDRDPNEAQRLTFEPATDHPAGAQLRCTSSMIPQVPHTFAVLLSRPWWMWGAEMGTNEHAVTIGNEAVFTRRRPGAKAERPLLGMDLVRLGLERAVSARDAVQVIVDLLERHGQGGSCSAEHPRFSYDNSYLIADRAEAYVLETAGRAHAVELVTGRARSISNGLTIPAFARAYADPVRARMARHTARSTITTRHAAGADSVLDLFAALRDHGPYAAPSFSPVNGALGAPCAHAGGLVTSTQTTASWVADLRHEPRHWVTGTAAACLSAFLPVRCEPVPPGLTEPDSLSNRFDAASRWWRQEVLHRSAIRDYGAALARIRPDRDRLERAWVADLPDTESCLRDVQPAQERWLADLVELPDTRPAWLRALWRRWNQAAGLASPGKDGTAGRPVAQALVDAGVDPAAAV